MPSGINFQISGSKFALMQLHTSDRLFCMVMRRHLLGATDSIQRNLGL